MTITTINSEENKKPQQPSLIARLTAKVRGVKMKKWRKHKVTRQLATDIIYQMKSRGEKTTPLVMNQIFSLLFTAEAPWCASGRGWGLVMAESGVRRRRRAVWEGGCSEGGLCYLLGFACPVHYESCIAHFMASVLEQIITGWREREREKGGVRGGRAWFCSQKMSSRVSSLQIPDYAHPYNCFTLSTDLFTLFIYSGIQQVSLSPSSTEQKIISLAVLL